jgi:hypothetical protein
LFSFSEVFSLAKIHFFRGRTALFSPESIPRKAMRASTVFDVRVAYFVCFAKEGRPKLAARRKHASVAHIGEVSRKKTKMRVKKSLRLWSAAGHFDPGGHATEAEDLQSLAILSGLKKFLYTLKSYVEVM